jgi:hypothetical protein
MIFLGLELRRAQNQAMHAEEFKKKIVLIGGELVFLASANTTAGETVPL